MLLQGFACDSSLMSAPGANAAAGRSLASPPASPPQLSAPNTFGNLLSSCRSLQALLQAPASCAAAPVQLTQPHLTPPLAHALPPSPMKLRPRSPKTTTAAAAASPDLPSPSSARRIVKRQPVRGAHKRRRTVGGDDDDNNNNNNNNNSPNELPMLAPSPMHRTPAVFAVAPVPFNLPITRSSTATTASTPRPTTPKRARIAPDALPLGLARADFHALHADGLPNDHNDGERMHAAAAAGTDVEREGDGSEWAVEDDRMLVELVLEKLRLSKEEWQDCARTLGKDRASLGRRWRSLVQHGAVGLRGRRVRGRV